MKEILYYFRCQRQNNSSDYCDQSLVLYPFWQCERQAHSQRQKEQKVHEHGSRNFVVRDREVVNENRRDQDQLRHSRSFSPDKGQGKNQHKREHNSCASRDSSGFWGQKKHQQKPNHIHCRRFKIHIVHRLYIKHLPETHAIQLPFAEYLGC